MVGISQFVFSQRNVIKSTFLLVFLMYIFPEVLFMSIMIIYMIIYVTMNSSEKPLGRLKIPTYYVVMLIWKNKETVLFLKLFPFTVRVK